MPTSDSNIKWSVATEVEIESGLVVMLLCSSCLVVDATTQKRNMSIAKQTAKNKQAKSDANKSRKLSSFFRLDKLA